MNILASQELIGWSLLLSAALSIMGFIFLALMFSVRIYPYGRLNDITVVLSLLVLLPYALGVYGSLSMDHPIPGLIALLTGISGIGLVAVTQARLVLKKVALEKNMPQVALGTGLLGTSILLNNLLSQSTKLFPNHHSLSGTATGILMAMGIPTALFFGKELLNMMSGKLDWAKANKAALAVIMLSFLGQIGYLVWTIGLGNYLIH